MKYIKKAICLLVIGCLLFSLNSCSETNTSISSEVVDLKPDHPVLVNGVTINRCPQRVISLSAVITEIIFSLGSNDRLVGVSDYCNYPIEALKLPHLGTAINPKIDELLKLNPEIVLASSSLPKDIKEKLKLQKIPIVIISGAKSKEDLRTLYYNVAAAMSGKYTGKTNSDNTLKNIFDKINAFSTKVSGSIKPTAVIILSLNVGVATGDTLGSYLLESAGAVNVAKSAKNYNFSKEELLLKNPDYIFCSEEDSDKIKKDAAYSGLHAVKENRVIVVDIEAIDRGGDRIITVALKMARIMFPNKFI